MPIYEYGCTKCGKTHEIMQKFSDVPLSICPECGADVKKLISNTSFVLKGTGWYATDYASPKNSESRTDKKPAPAEAEKSKPESQPETKNDAKAEPKKEEVAAK
jgi:putative FmdB family regulatory protein